MSGNDWLKRTKSQCPGSYMLPLFPDMQIGATGAGACPICERTLRLMPQGIISRHNTPQEAPA